MRHFSPCWDSSLCVHFNPECVSVCDIPLVRPRYCCSLWLYEQQWNNEWGSCSDRRWWDSRRGFLLVNHRDALWQLLSLSVMRLPTPPDTHLLKLHEDAFRTLMYRLRNKVQGGITVKGSTSLLYMVQIKSTDGQFWTEPGDVEILVLR